MSDLWTDYDPADLDDWLLGDDGNDAPRAFTTTVDDDEDDRERARLEQERSDNLEADIDRALDFGGEW
jgi:hypothetical protein